VITAWRYGGMNRVKAFGVSEKSGTLKRYENHLLHVTTWKPFKWNSKNIFIEIHSRGLTITGGLEIILT